MSKRYSYHGVGEQHLISLGWWVVIIGVAIFWLWK